MEIADRGHRVSADDYRQWLPTAFETILNWADRLPKHMGEGDFDDPQDTDTQIAWSRLLELTNEMLDFAANLKASPPPPVLLATHRALIRGVLLFGAASVKFLTTLTAPTAGIALERMRSGQEMLDAACTTTVAAANLMTPLDPLAVTAASGSSISHVFPELKEIVRQDPVMLRPLIPLVPVARGMHDQQRRSRRVAAVQIAFDAASAVEPQWIGDFDYFLGVCSAAWRKLIDQHRRLNHVLTHPDRMRPGWVDEVLDIGAKAVEGPYRAYGSLVLTASKVANGSIAILDASTASNNSFGAVRSGLTTFSPELAEGIHPVIRNASAHYDYRIDDDVVRISHRPPRSSEPIVEEHSFDDLLAAVSNLSEHTVAMAIGVMRWMWLHGTVADRERFRRDWLSA
ncbi:hypothetical protein VMT65_36875 [Nocardia sp. CDC153]|uniref:hypothetical protein n=1 Tax=Nocardia sp. CDC153 TaxID=3112167 RepID=UPI002DB79572|nr:hypothetical protein [Nocardia sp. CDC153]MEC3958659.1 hypothetical protein [Nocardia sp. CDC153]